MAHVVPLACGLLRVGNPPGQGSANAKTYSPSLTDRRWGIWGSCCNIPKAIFYLKGDYKRLVGSAMTFRHQRSGLRYLTREVEL